MIERKFLLRWNTHTIELYKDIYHSGNIRQYHNVFVVSYSSMIRLMRYAETYKSYARIRTTDINRVEIIL